MKIPKVFILVFLVFFVIELKSNEILISKPIEVNNHSPKFKIIGKNDAGYWIRNYGKNEERIDLYDNGLNFILSRTILVKRNNFFPLTYSLNEKGASFFYTDYHKKNFYLCSSLISNRIESGNEKVIDTMIFQSSSEDMRISFSYSLNKQNVVFFVPMYVNNQLSQMRVISMRNTGEIIFKSSIPVSRENAQAFAEDALVDNNGNTYLFMKYEIPNISTFYEVKKIAKNGVVIDSCFLNFANNIFNDPILQIDEKNKKLICYAFLSGAAIAKPGANSLSNFSINLDSMKVVSASEFNFSDSFIEDVTNGVVKTNGALYTFKIKKVIPTIDGGSVCIAESFYKEDNEVRDGIDMGMLTFGGSGYPPSTRIVNIFHYNDILVFYFNKEGKCDKYEIIRKKQVTENDNGSFSSFFVANNRTSLKLLFVDDIALKTDFVQHDLSNSLELKQKILLNEDEKNLMLIPKMAVQTQVNEVVLPSYRNNDFRLIKINF